MMLGRILENRRARSAASQLLGIRGRVTGTTEGGSPIVEVGGHRLAFRRNAGDTYFRFVVPCDDCATSVTSRRVRVATPEDLLQSPGLTLCRVCRSNREAHDPDEALLKAKALRNYGGQPVDRHHR